MEVILRQYVEHLGKRGDPDDDRDDRFDMGNERGMDR